METPNDENNKIIEEAYRLAEQNLQSQIDIALAADQRAVSFCGLAIAAVAVLVGLADKSNLSLILGISTLLLTVSATLSAFSFRPVKFHVRGLPSENFESDITEKKKYIEVITDLSKIYDDLITKNNKIIKRNASHFRLSIISALLGLGLLTFPVIYGSIVSSVYAVVDSGEIK